MASIGTHVVYQGPVMVRTNYLTDSLSIPPRNNLNPTQAITMTEYAAVLQQLDELQAVFV